MLTLQDPRSSLAAFSKFQVNHLIHPFCFPLLTTTVFVYITLYSRLSISLVIVFCFFFSWIFKLCLQRTRSSPEHTLLRIACSCLVFCPAEMYYLFLNYYVCITLYFFHQFNGHVLHWIAVLFFILNFLLTYSCLPLSEFFSCCGTL